jgi:hypothetical protein
MAVRYIIFGLQGWKPRFEIIRGKDAGRTIFDRVLIGLRIAF